MSDCLKILQVVHGFPPHDQAGTEVYTETISTALARRPEIASVDVFARRGQPERPDYETELLERADITVHFVNHCYRSLHALEDLHRNERIDAIFEKLLEQLRPDVVHVQHLIGLSTGIVPLSRRSGARVVFTLPDFWYQCVRGQRIDWKGRRCDEVDLGKCARCLGRKQVAYLVNAVRDRALGRDDERSPLVRFATIPGILARHLARDIGVAPFERRREEMRSMLLSADAVIGPSRFILDEYQRFFGLDSDKLVHADYGMDQSWLDRLPEERNGSGPLRFGFVGTFLPTKGVDLLVRAFDSIRRPDAELHLFGRAPEHMQAFERSLRSSSDNPRILFHGGFAHDRLAEVLSKIDVLVVPSVWFENSPLTLHEAALARIPVLTSNLGGMREFVERHGNGLLFEPESQSDLRARILEILQNPSMLEGLARPKLPIRTPDQDAEGLLELYQRLLAKRPASHRSVPR